MTPPPKGTIVHRGAAPTMDTILANLAPAQKAELRHALDPAIFRAYALRAMFTK